MSSCVSGISSHYRAAFHAGGWCAVCLAVHQCGDTGFRDISRFGGSYISRLLQPGVNKAVMEEHCGDPGESPDPVQVEEGEQTKEGFLDEAPLYKVRLR